METIDVALTYPDILKDAKELDKDVKSGAYKQYVSLEEVIAKQKGKKSSHK